MAGAFFAYRKMTAAQTRIFINGNVLTMDPSDTVAQAVAIHHGKIMAVGDNEFVRSRAAKNSRVTDLKGRTLIPGFIDAHSHFPASGIEAVAVDLNSPPIGTTTDISQIINALKIKAEQTKKGKWIIGYGYDDTLLKEMRHPTRRDLDLASTDHPIVIAHISGHVAVLNSKALEIMGIDAATPDPQGGVIRKDPDTGEPDGVLEETATHAIKEKALDFTVFQLLGITRRAVHHYTSTGITTAQSGLVEKKLITPLSWMCRLGVIPLRVMAWPDADAADTIISGHIKPEKLNSPRFRLGAVKLFADGSIQAYTGYFTKPYHTPFKGDEEYRGYPIHKREDLTDLVVKYHSAGYQIAIHGNGDAAIDDIIHAVSTAQKMNPCEDPRHIVIHSQTARPDQLDAMKEVGLTPSFHAVHPYYWGDRHHAIFLGPERTSRISPMHTAAEKGLRFTTHLDTPVVPMDPLFLVWCAVNRRSSSGRVIGPGERISPLQALRSVTIDAAWQIFQEHNRGSIETGKLADLVVLSGNPLDNPEAIKDIKIIETIVGGRTVFQK